MASPSLRRVFILQIIFSGLLREISDTRQMDLTKKRKLDENGQVDSDSQLTTDDVRKIIESFTQEQLLSIVQNAAVLHSDVLDAVRSIADLDAAQRKLFIRALGCDTTTETLRALFSTYGDIDEGTVVIDKATGKNKGFGFVTMRHIDGALLALKDPSKKIDGRMTVTQLATPGIQGPLGNSQPVVPPDVSNRRIYVGNVPEDMTGDRLLEHFTLYGEIEAGPLGFDKGTGKSRGYALFVYKTMEAARASLVDRIKTIDGHQLNCKLANDPPKRWKPEVSVVVAPGVGGGGQGSAGVPVEAYGNGPGMRPPSSMSGPLGGQYGGMGGSYGAFFDGSQMGHHPLNSSMGGGGGPGFSSVGSQAQTSLGDSGGGSGLGGPYGGPGSAVYGGLGGAGGFGGAGGGMIDNASGFGGTGGGMVGNAGGFGGSWGGMVGSAGGFVGAGGGMVGSAGGFGGTGGGTVGSGGGFGGGGGGMVGSAGGFGGAGGGMIGSAGGLVGGISGGLGGSAGSLGGIGSASRDSSLYGGLPTSSAGLHSGTHLQSAHYSLSSSGYGSQDNHPAGTSPVNRVPPGGRHQGGTLYY